MTYGQRLFCVLELFRLFVLFADPSQSTRTKMTSSIEVTPENFVRAVETLYHDQDSARKKIASEWLLSVQSSVIHRLVFFNYLFPIIQRLCFNF